MAQIMLTIERIETPITIKIIHRQGNEETLEIQNESYRFNLISLHIKKL